MSSYAGIGSRRTPKQFIDKFIEIGEFLALKEITLRSGGADGADQALRIAIAHGIPIINAGEFTVDMFDKLVKNFNFE